MTRKPIFDSVHENHENLVELEKNTSAQSPSDKYWDVINYTLTA